MTATEDEKKKALEDMPANSVVSSMVDAWFREHQNTIRKLLTPAKVDGDEVGEPPCGDRCPKDEDCDNYGIGGEPCPHAATSQQGREFTDIACDNFCINDGSSNVECAACSKRSASIEGTAINIYKRILSENPAIDKKRGWIFNWLEDALAAKGIIRVKV